MMTKETMRPHPKGRGAYRHFTSFATRWRDNDQYGHMNNAVYYELFDSAVNKFLIDSGILALAGDKTLFLVASSGCDYFTEVAYPDDVDVGIAIRRIGSSSITYDVGLFLAGADKTAATGFFVHVNVASDDQRPCPIDAVTREKCAALVVGTGQSC
jgi:acyl-CoA thioester hydrolase